jgi:tRNA threonylcarbamoyladenosine biosynthesis protein TsaB
MKLLAIDTSTDVMSLAVQHGEAVFAHSGPGGARTSAELIPAILALLKEAGLALSELDAIAFGRGPGSFTGLRTACAVAQGLAFGAGLKLLPVDTLATVAEEARHAHFGAVGAAGSTGSTGSTGSVGAAGAVGTVKLCAALDARMGEWYVAYYEFNSALLPYDGDIGGIFYKSAENSFQLVKPSDFTLPAGARLVGSLPANDVAALGLTCLPAMPTATAMLRLAPALLARGLAIAPELALPLYVRDKVAQTTQERDDAKLALAASSLAQ